MREDGGAVSSSGRDDALCNLPDTILIEQCVHQTKAVQLSGFAFRFFRDFHCTEISLEVSSARRRWSSAVRILPVTLVVARTTSLPTSRLSSASICSWSCEAASRALAVIC